VAKPMFCHTPLSPPASRAGRRCWIPTTSRPALPAAARVTGVDGGVGLVSCSLGVAVLVGDGAIRGKTIPSVHLRAPEVRACRWRPRRRRPQVGAEPDRGWRRQAPNVGDMDQGDVSRR